MITEAFKITKAIQVCFEFNELNKQREINGLNEAMIKFNLNEGLILTYDLEDEFRIEDKKIKLIPVWRWLI